MDRLISEQAVIEAIEFFQMNPQHFDFVNLIDDIKEIPSAEPKTGHWIIIDDCEKFMAKCSECGQIEDSRMIGKYAYCHCGARMESEENNG